MISSEIVISDTIGESDADAIANIENSSFSQPWSRSLIVQELIRSFDVSIAARMYAPNYETMPMVGYMFARFIADELYILRIAVEPILRKSGIASSMLKFCLKKAKRSGVRSIFLEVRDCNLPARGLYEKFGFRLAGIRPNYYTDSGEDALILKKNL